jgi:hypothetical protein
MCLCAKIINNVIFYQFCVIVKYKVLVGKCEGKRPLERPRRIWEDGIRMDLREIAWGGGWIGFD